MICSFYFVWVVILFRIVRDSFAHTFKLGSFDPSSFCFVLYLLLFNFQWPLSVAFRRPTWIVYHIRFPLSIPFWKVFWIFSNSFSLSAVPTKLLAVIYSFLCRFSTALTLYHRDLLLSRAFWRFLEVCSQYHKSAERRSTQLIKCTKIRYEIT